MLRLLTFAALFGRPLPDKAVEILVKIKHDSPQITKRRIETPGLILRQAFDATTQEYFDSLLRGVR